MNIFKRTKSEEEKELLKKRVDDAQDIIRMKKTAGWKLLEKLFTEQLEVYKADMLLGCKSFDEYQDKRGKAWGINLILTDIEDYIRMGEEAGKELDEVNG